MFVKAHKSLSSVGSVWSTRFDQTFIEHAIFVTYRCVYQGDMYRNCFDLGNLQQGELKQGELKQKIATM